MVTVGASRRMAPPEPPPALSSAPPTLIAPVLVTVRLSPAEICRAPPLGPTMFGVAPAEPATRGMRFAVP